MSTNYIVIIAIAIALVLIVISIIKKAFKLLIFIIIILLGFVAYDVFVRGVSPIDEITGIQTDASYVQDLSSYTSKIKDAIDTTKNAVTSKQIDAATIKIVQDTNTKLNDYNKEISSLKHTIRMDGVQKQYESFIEPIISTSNSLAQTISEKNANIKDIESKVNSLNTSLSGLTALKLN